MSIVALDSDTVKLINTSQSIASPVAVVKELLENALDADAKNIDIYLTNGGSSLIEVKDDGCGISQKDAPFMALPSYTSKILAFSDLENLRTYGFRGMALASLCALAKVTVITKTEEDDVAYTYIMDQSGQATKSSMCHRTRGTTVRVVDLFKGLPVRRQVITSSGKSIQAIKSLEALLKSYGLSKYSTRINCKVDNDILFCKPAVTSVNKAALYIFGTKLISNMDWLEIDDTKVSAKLLIPSARPQLVAEIFNPMAQYIFVNERPIHHKHFDKLLTKTILEGLHQDTALRKKPVFVLYLSLNPADIDVNVEPDKFGVFFQNEAYVSRLIESRLRSFYGLDCNEGLANANADISVNDISNQSAYLPDSLPEAADPTDCVGPTRKRQKIDSSNEVKMNTKKRLSSATRISVPECENNILRLSTSSSGASDGRPSSSCSRHSDAAKSDDSLLLELIQDMRKENIEETLSQLPVVDLGEDFEWKTPQITERACNARDDQVEENIVLKLDSPTNEKSDPKTNISKNISLESWSKGQIDGLASGVNVEVFSEKQHHTTTSNCDKTKSIDKRPLTEVNRPISNNKNCLGFLHFIRQKESGVVESRNDENASVSAPQKVQTLITRWKELPSKERAQYRELGVNSMFEKLELPQEVPTNEQEENTESAVVKTAKSSAKPVNSKKRGVLVTRTTVPWNIDIRKISESSEESGVITNNSSLIGTFQSDIWIIYRAGSLWALDSVRARKENSYLDTVHTDLVRSRDTKDLNLLLERYFSETDDLSALHMICPVNL